MTTNSKYVTVAKKGKGDAVYFETESLLSLPLTSDIGSLILEVQEKLHGHTVTLLEPAKAVIKNQSTNYIC